jgi:hypothetical protein
VTDEPLGRPGIAAGVELEEVEEVAGPAAPPDPGPVAELEVVDRQPGADSYPEGPRRIWALLALDPSTGCATTVVAIAGVDGRTPGKVAVSWVPLCEGADAGWRQRLADATVPLADIVDQVDEAGAVGADVVELDPSTTAVDLEGAVEMAMDEVLAMPYLGQG